MGNTTNANPGAVPRSDTPITDAFREAIKDPKVAQEFADYGNALAAGLRTASGVNTGTIQAAPVEPIKSPIAYDDFAKVELRAATILSAERVPKKTRLLKLQVDFGEATPRQVLAGIGETFQPEDLVNVQLLFVSNLAPRVIAGIESNGMVLATGEPSKLSVVKLPVPVPNGSRFQ